MHNLCIQLHFYTTLNVIMYTVTSRLNFFVVLGTHSHPLEQAMSNFHAHPLPPHKRPSYSRPNDARQRYGGHCDDVTVEILRMRERSFKAQIHELRYNSGADLIASTANPASVNHWKCSSADRGGKKTCRVRPSPRKNELEMAKYLYHDRDKSAGSKCSVKSTVSKSSNATKK